MSTTSLEVESSIEWSWVEEGIQASLDDLEEDINEI